MTFKLIEGSCAHMICAAMGKTEENRQVAKAYHNLGCHHICLLFHIFDLPVTELIRPLQPAARRLRGDSRGLFTDLAEKIRGSPLAVSAPAFENTMAQRGIHNTG